MGVEAQRGGPLQAEQLSRLARLIDEWLDVAASGRRAWLDAAEIAHPDLAGKLRAIAAKPARDRSASIDPLSFSGLGAAAANDAEGRRGGDVAGPYRLVSLLGRGGMGAVWLAEQVDGRLSRRVALKLPHPGLAQGDWRRRFERERDILAGLDHPGIAKLFEAGAGSDGQPYLAMQLVEGEPLDAYARERRLGVAERAKLFIELLGIAQHAHTALVAHRDLKPANILVGAGGRPMLLDFGIAKLMGERSAHANGATELAGPALTLDYASPEQVAGRAVGAASDIYSLGVVLHELLSGRRPYRLRRASRAEMEEAVLGQEPRPPSARVDAEHASSMGLDLRQARRRLRGDLDAIVLKALRKEPERRYATAQAFADDLGRFLRREPVSAGPDALGYRARKLFARRWRELAVGGAVAVALVASTAAALVQARDARESGEMARAEARRAEVVTAFLQDLFLSGGARQADPEAARKRTAEQLIGDAAERIGGALADAPEEKIALLRRLAQTSFEMRLPEQARALARQAADLAARVYGPGDLRARLEEAYWMRLSAAGLRGDAFDSRMGELGRGLPELAASANAGERQLARYLCEALMNRDFQIRSEQALAWAALAERALAGEPEGAESFGLRHMLGVVYFENLRLAEAEREFEATQRMRESLGIAARDAESYPTWRGRLKELTGRHAEAEALMREGYAMERANDAGGTRLNDWGLADYARFLVDAGRPAEALALLANGGPLAGPEMRAKLPGAFRSLRSQAHALASLGRSEEAVASAQRADRLMREAFDESLRPPLPALAEAYLVAGRIDDAMRLLDREEARMARARTADMARAMGELRLRALIALGRAAEARSYLESRRAILSPEGGGPAERARLAWLDGGVALLEGKPAEARGMLAEAIRELAQAPADERAYLGAWSARLHDRSGDAALAMGDARGAKAAFESAMAGYGGFVDPASSMVLARVATRLAQADRLLGERAAARWFDAQARAIAARHPGQAGWGA